jgi:hypothetical protein
MLQKPIEEIIYENGRAVGVKSEGEVCLVVTLTIDCQS